MRISDNGYMIDGNGYPYIGSRSAEALPENAPQIVHNHRSYEVIIANGVDHRNNRASQEKKDTSLVDWISGIWKKFVGFISYYLFCECWSKKTASIKVIPKSEKEQLKKAFTELKANFIAWRDEDNSANKDEFRKKWKEHFENLKPKMKEVLIREQLYMTSKSKSSLENDKEREEWVNESYKNQIQKEKAREFVQDLRVSRVPNGTIYDPIQDEFVPGQMQQIIDAL